MKSPAGGGTLGVSGAVLRSTDLAASTRIRVPVSCALAGGAVAADIPSTAALATAPHHPQPRLLLAISPSLEPCLAIARPITGGGGLSAPNLSCTSSAIGHLMKNNNALMRRAQRLRKRREGGGAADVPRWLSVANRVIPGRPA